MTWTLHKVQQDNLLIFKRKILRKIFGYYLDTNIGNWKKRYEKTKNSMRFSNYIKKLLLWTKYKKYVLLV